MSSFRASISTTCILFYAHFYASIRIHEVFCLGKTSNGYFVFTNIFVLLPQNYVFLVKRCTLYKVCIEKNCCIRIPYNYGRSFSRLLYSPQQNTNVALLFLYIITSRNFRGLFYFYYHLTKTSITSK